VALTCATPAEIFARALLYALRSRAHVINFYQYLEKLDPRDILFSSCQQSPLACLYGARIGMRTLSELAAFT